MFVCQRQIFFIALIRDYINSFFNKCRTYERLIKKNINEIVAIRCFDYLIILANKENKLRERFGVTSWNRSNEEYLESTSRKQSFRAIVKDLIIEDVSFTARIAKKILLDLRRMRNFEVYNMNI